ncbi:palmitoyltransferase ZDHHC21-like isoform X2 [Watersipora subatra]|uniref:palmitoyltransferase ZDHHC21-like isoform X2 n=1 Tax=Watersipora subatra TaxID=2589382 RepID=UPI00355C6FD1
MSIRNKPKTGQCKEGLQQTATDAEQMNWNLPSNIRDRAAFTLFLIAGPLDLLYERYVVTEHYLNQGHHINCYYYGLLVFCALNIYIRLYNVVTIDNRPSSLPLDRKLAIHTTIETCEKCGELRPPESHHCKVCNVCILKRDHHCWFTGTCIGLHNQANFVILVWYLWLVAAIETAYNMEFVCHDCSYYFYSLYFYTNS